MDDFSIRIRSIKALQEQKGSICESIVEMKEIFKNLMEDERCSARMQNQIDRIQKGEYEDMKTGDLPVEFGVQDLKHWAPTEVLKGIAADLDRETNLYITESEVITLSSAASNIHLSNHRVQESVHDLKALIYAIRNKQSERQLAGMKRAWREKQARQNDERSKGKAVGESKIQGEAGEREKEKTAVKEEKVTLEQRLLADVEALITTGQGILADRTKDE